MKNKIKKTLALLLAAAMVIGMLAGCSKTGNDTPATDAPQQGSETQAPTEAEKSRVEKILDTDYTVTWYIDGDGAQEDVEAVEAEFNRYMKEEMNSNLKLKLVEYDWGSYTEKMNAMMSTSEYFDLCFAADWALPNGSNIQEGKWLPWDEYLDLVPEYTELLAPYREKIKDKGEDGVAMNYVMPTMKEMAWQGGLVFNKTAADACGITEDLYNLKSLDDLPALFDIYLEKFPEGIPYIATSSSLTSYFKTNFNLYTFFDNDADEYRIGFETPEFEQYLNTLRSWSKAGYIPEYEQTMENSELFNMHGECSFLVWFSGIKPGFEEERNPANLENYGWEYGITPMTQATITRSSILGNTTALSRTSKNPEAAAYLYQLICTNEYLTNLINFGIEGTHYTREADGSIAPVENSKYWPNMPYYLGNRYLDYKLKGEPDGLGKLYEEFNNAAITLKNDGFSMDPAVWDTTNYSAVLNNVQTQFGTKLVCGTITDAELAELKDKAYGAGIEDYVAALNAEYTKWKEANK